MPDFDDYDLVLIADYGHGLLDGTAINQKIAARERAVVAAMTQVNSSNYGYNLPIKYIGADYYSLNRTEAELCLHERQLPLPELVERSARLLQADAVSVTDGAAGRVRQGRRRSVRDAVAERERHRHDRLRRRVFRVEQRGRSPSGSRPASSRSWAASAPPR